METASARVTAAQRLLAEDPYGCVVELLDDAPNRARDLDALPAEQREQLPLFGIPIAVKDCLDITGTITGHGGVANSVPAQSDSALIARLRDAGAVLVAKTRLSELGIEPFTRGPWGQTGNPAWPDRACGGSSGGAAVAVCSGAVPVAIGADMGGSVRIPAACVGVVGFKPSRGRWPIDSPALMWGDLGTYGALAWTVEDIREIDAVLADHAPATPASSNVTVAVPDSPPEGLSELALRRAMTAIEGLGWQTVPLAESAASVGARGWVCRLAYALRYPHAVWGAVQAVQHPERVQPVTAAIARMGRWPGQRPARAVAGWLTRRAAADVGRAFTQADLLLTATLLDPPPPQRPAPATVGSLLTQSRPRWPPPHSGTCLVILRSRCQSWSPTAPPLRCRWGCS